MLKKFTKNQARAVFEILIRENQAMLMTYLRAVLRNRSSIDDLFQETMLIAWQKLEEYDRSRPFGPWLRGIAGNIVKAYYRKTKSDFMLCHDEVLEQISQQLQHISERPGDSLDEKIAALEHCIDALSDHYRQAIKLRYFEQTPASQIAEISKTTVETIKKRLQRARSQLFDCLRCKKCCCGDNVMTTEQNKPENDDIVDELTGEWFDSEPEDSHRLNPSMIRANLLTKNRFAE